MASQSQTSSAAPTFTAFRPARFTSNRWHDHRQSKHELNQLSIYIAQGRIRSSAVSACGSARDSPGRGPFSSADNRFVIMNHGDGASTISGISAASSSSSKRFKLFRFGKRRGRKENGSAGASLDKNSGHSSIANGNNNNNNNNNYDYGYEDNEQAPRQQPTKQFETLLEVDDSSDDDSPRQNGGGGRSADDASSVGNNSKQNSVAGSASSSSSGTSSDDDSASSLSQSGINDAKSPVTKKRAVSTPTQIQVQQPQQQPVFSSTIIEPQHNLKILIPRRKRRKPPTPYSILTRTKFFQNMINNAFEMVDTDRTGFVDEKQLYNALLLIHLKLGMVAGQAACRPLPRERSRAIFEKFDIEENGYLNREEFGKVMVLMFSNVLFRVAVQWSMTILIVPLVAKEILDTVSWANASALGAATTLAEQYWVFMLIQRALSWVVWRCFYALPAGVFVLLDTSNDWMLAVPDRVWSAVPLTLLSTLLGILIVPLLIFKIDSLTQWLADRRHTKKIRKRIEAGETTGW